VSLIKHCVTFTSRNTGADPGFFKGSGWYIRAEEPMGQAPKMLHFEKLEPN